MCPRKAYPSSKGKVRALRVTPLRMLRAVLEIIRLMSVIEPL